ncbi:MAG: hypothetical protein E6J63_15470 [Deltaproteobacteria bacterium]|nr:MAG: hypothetical protein E6J63_15470 [Deltaproteobacteria bacterium]
MALHKENPIDGSTIWPIPTGGPVLILGEGYMSIRSVSVDILALLTCLGGSWSCGGNVDSSSESPRAIGAAHIETTRDGTDVDPVVHCSSPSAARYSDWSTPVNLGPIVNSEFNEQNAQLLKDGLAIYFSSKRDGGVSDQDIYVTRRASVDSPWKPPVKLGPPVNTESADFAPNVSIDGHLLFWASNRPGGHGNADLYMSRRDDPNDDHGWGEPVNLGPKVNTGDFEQAPNYHQNAEEGGGNLYFNRGNPTLNLADLYYVAVSRDGVAHGDAVQVPGLNTTGANEQAASLRHDGKEVFFFSNRPGGWGDLDIWTSTRRNTHDVWSAPVNLGPRINTPVLDVTPNLSFDGLTMILGSNRPGGVGGNDLYVTTRSKHVNDSDDEDCAGDL